MTKAKVKIQCKDENGIVGSFYYDPETGKQLTKTFPSFYDLTRWNIDNGRPFGEPTL